MKLSKQLIVYFRYFLSPNLKEDTLREQDMCKCQNREKDSLFFFV